MAATAPSIRSDYYVYALFRENGVPFYIGKGMGNRWEHHEGHARRGSKGYKHEVIRGMQSRGIEVIKIRIHDGLTEALAHTYEIALIKAIGRRPIGPLANLTDGGDGVTGFRHTPGKKRSPSHIANLTAALRGKKRSPEHIAQRSAKRRGKKLSLQARANIGAGQRGRQKSPQECANIAAGKLGTKASLATRAILSAAHRGIPWSAARRAAQDRRRVKVMPEDR